MLLSLLLTLNIMICLALVAVVLLQRSEGGAMGSGSPTGLITTRGAGDLLTRTTWVLFSLFLAISLALTLLGGRERSSQAILNRLKSQSINPDALPAPTQTPASSPGAASPPPLTASPVQPPVSGPAATGQPPLAAPRPKVRIAPSAALERDPSADATPAPAAAQFAPSSPKLVPSAPSSAAAPAAAGPPSSTPGKP